MIFFQKKEVNYFSRASIIGYFTKMYSVINQLQSMVKKEVVYWGSDGRILLCRIYQVTLCMSFPFMHLL